MYNLVINLRNTQTIIYKMEASKKHRFFAMILALNCIYETKLSVIKKLRLSTRKYSSDVCVKL